MRITVCRLGNAQDGFAADWDRLVGHVRAERSALVLLPEMPFYPWLAAARRFDPRTWSAAVSAHDQWQTRLSELGPAVVFGTRPIDYGDLRYSAGFWWNAGEDIAQTVHVKSRLWSEQGAWETDWYEAERPDFKIATVKGIGIGMLIGAELWTPGQGKLYGEDGAHIIAVPAIDHPPDQGADVADDAWIAAGRDAARASGAYCISSTRATGKDSPGGAGWIIAPDGATVAITSVDEPIVTAEVAITMDDADPRDAEPWNRA